MKIQLTQRYLWVWVSFFILFFHCSSSKTANVTDGQSSQDVTDAAQHSDVPDAGATRDATDYIPNFYVLVSFALDERRSDYGILSADGSLTLWRPAQLGKDDFYGVFDLFLETKSDSTDSILYGLGYFGAAGTDGTLDTVTLFKNGEHEQLSRPSEVDPQTDFKFSPGKNRLVVKAGTPHMIIDRVRDKQGKWRDFYYNGKDFVDLPPPGNNTFELDGIKLIEDDIYIYGFEVDASDETNEIRPLVWKNGALIDTFPTFKETFKYGDDVWFDLDLYDLALNEKGEILLAGMYRHHEQPTICEIGYFKSNNTYVAVGDQQSTVETSIHQILSEKDYLILRTAGYTADDVVIDGKVVDMEQPSHLDILKPVEYKAMVQSGKDFYILGHNQYGENPFKNKVTVWKNTQIVFQAETISPENQPQSYISALDLVVP